MSPYQHNASWRLHPHFPLYRLLVLVRPISDFLVSTDYLLLQMNSFLITWNYVWLVMLLLLSRHTGNVFGKFFWLAKSGFVQKQVYYLFSKYDLLWADKKSYCSMDLSWSYEFKKSKIYRCKTRKIMKAQPKKILEYFSWSARYSWSFCFNNSNNIKYSKNRRGMYILHTFPKGEE